MADELKSTRQMICNHVEDSACTVSKP